MVDVPCEQSRLRKIEGGSARRVWLMLFLRQRFFCVWRIDPRRLFKAIKELEVWKKFRLRRNFFGASISAIALIAVSLRASSLARFRGSRGVGRELTRRLNCSLPGCQLFVNVSSINLWPPDMWLCVWDWEHYPTSHLGLKCWCFVLCILWHHAKSIRKACNQAVLALILMIVSPLPCGIVLWHSFCIPRG